MAEQNFTQAIKIADRGYVIVHGKIAFEGRSADELNNNELDPQVLSRPLAVARSAIAGGRQRLHLQPREPAPSKKRRGCPATRPGAPAACSCP